MSVPNLIEEPLDRLNYFNSQRLEALDFRLEQAYHIRVRRWLNKSLYASGIAAGLEVQKDPDDPHSVIVSPGLALDIDGREIIVLEEQRIKVCGTPKRPDGVQLGNYLVISYGEAKVAPLQDGCRVVTPKSSGASAPCSCRGSGFTAKVDCGCGGSTSSSTSTARDYSWGAPSRIRSEPLLLFQDAWPSDTQRKILLGQVVLNDTCQVEDILAGMRRYTTAIKPPNTTPISIEGEKDIDASNPKILRFHIEGGFPGVATLYLQAAKFSSLFYTEMGRHKHTITVTVDPHDEVKEHFHTLDEITTELESPEHTHRINARTKSDQDGIDLAANDAPNTNLNDKVGLSVSDGEHFHKILAGTTTGPAGQLDPFLHVVDATLGFEGVSSPTTLNTGPKLTFVDGLLVSFDGVDITPQILAQLQAMNAPAWAVFGDGTGTHELVTNGTGAIDLRQLGVDLSPGAHTLLFQVSSGGGQIQYNLYVS